MNRWIGAALAAVFIALAYTRWGWQGAVAGVTLVVFWLLLQFTRMLRVMRRAGEAPVGHVASAVMLQSQLRTGLTLLQLLPLTGSLGQRQHAPEGAERWRWADAGGAAVVVTLRGGRVTEWQFTRPEDAPPAEPAAAPAEPPQNGARAPR